MSQFKHSLTVNWGDCDDAGIVFYPTFFYWFDSTYHAFLRSANLKLRDLRERYQAVTPLMDAGSNFRSPVTYDDVITIEAVVAEWALKRFRLEYTVTCGDRLIASGYELRSWATVDEQGRLKGSPIPDEFKAALGGPVTQG